MDCYCVDNDKIISLHVLDLTKLKIHCRDLHFIEVYFLLSGQFLDKVVRKLHVLRDNL